MDNTWQSTMAELEIGSAPAPTPTAGAWNNEYADPDRVLAQFEHLGSASQWPHFQKLLEVIHIIHLFEDFSRQDILRFADHMQCFRASAGSQIVYEGEPGDFMMIILDGHVSVLKSDDTGYPRKIGTATAGATLGEMSLIDGEARSASCMALTPVIFAALKRADLRHLIADEPRIAIKLLTLLLLLQNQRLREVNTLVVDLAAATGQFV